MSKHRSACILHHKKLVLYITPKDNETSPYDNNCRNPKVFHADLLHRRWASKRTYSHFSQRLGISFDTKYHAYDQDIGIIPVQPVKDINVPTDKSTVSIDPTFDKVPSHLIPLIPEDPFYAGGVLNQPSFLNIKRKKLQPLTVGSDAWLAHMEEIYKRHETDRKEKENLLAYSIKWDTDPGRAEYREDSLNALMNYTNAFQDYEYKNWKWLLDHHTDNASTSTPVPYIMTDEEILEELHLQVIIYDDAIYGHYREAKLYYPENMVMDVNFNKRRADINGNLDTHYGLYMTKKVCTALNRLGSDISSSNDTK
ncbi:hypothetical protein RhiirA4_482798 [Rhizophagus irregularis]|uniref:DUF8211 domain-containing protein n=1 Tax=Rhizophagus irregularis TaxID=588596 RepID=A0A2I1HLN7_9GLOM|nr:hypothetical protein RhiirA4_482798 [Rhizophagus irregularis]